MTAQATRGAIDTHSNRRSLQHVMRARSEVRMMGTTSVTRVLAGAAACVALSVAGSCGSDTGAGEDGAACRVGDTRQCLGPAACPGAQTCLPDRSGFGPCDCGGGATGGAGGTPPSDAANDGVAGTAAGGTGGLDASAGGATGGLAGSAGVAGSGDAGVDSAVTDSSVEDVPQLDSSNPDAAPDASMPLTSLYFWGGLDDAFKHSAKELTLPGAVQTPLVFQSGLARVESLAVSHDGKTIALAHRSSAGPTGVWLYTPTGTFLGFCNASTPATEGRLVRRMAWSPSDEWVAIQAEYEAKAQKYQWSLYVCPRTGGSVKRVSRSFDQTTTIGVLEFAWAFSETPTSALLGFSETGSAKGIVSIVNAANPSPTATQVVANNTSAGYQRLGWDAQERFYFLSGHEYPAPPRLYRADPDGSNLVQVPWTALSNAGGEARVRSFGIDATGTKVAFAANSPDVDVSQVYVLDLNGSPSAAARSSFNAVSSPTSPDGPWHFNPIVWSRDGKWLAVIANWRYSASEPGNAAAFLIAPSGPVDTKRLLGGPSAVGGVVEVDFTADSNWLVARGSLFKLYYPDLYATSDFITADQSPAATLVAKPLTTIEGFTPVP
jgi:hypothetical protein